MSLICALAKLLAQVKSSRQCTHGTRKNRECTSLVMPALEVSFPSTREPSNLSEPESSLGGEESEKPRPGLAFL